MPEAFQSWKFLPTKQSTLQEKKLESSQCSLLLSRRRLDVAVKHRFFKHLIGGSDPAAEDLYRSLILARNGARMKQGVATDGWKLTVDHWVEAAQVLLDSMRDNGFLAQHAIPLDIHGELLNGTHRLACAMAIGLLEVYTWRVEGQEVWAPAWGREWFVEHHLGEDHIKRIEADFEALCGRQTINNEGC